MKTLLSAILLASLLACGNKKTSTPDLFKNNSLDSFAQLRKQSPDTIPIQKAVGDIRAFGQSILDNKIQPAENNETIACLDSLLSHNEDTRKFFFKVYRVIALKAEGYLVEISGRSTNAYLKTYPKECIDHLRKLPEQEQNIFVNNLVYEFAAVGQGYQSEIDSYFSDLTKSCTQCSINDNKFIASLKESLEKKVGAKYNN